MFRGFTTLALIALTTAFATAQTPSSGVKKSLPTAQFTPALKAGDLKVNTDRLIKHNVRVGDAGVVVNESGKSVTVTVQNLGTAQEASVGVRLGVADAIDGTLIFLDQTKSVGPIPAGGSRSITFTGLDFAAFKQSVVQQFGATNGNKLIVVAIADPKKVIAETDETDNHGIKFLK